MPYLKVWPHAEYPLIPVGKLVLNRNPVNYFAEVEQLGFSPASMIPGIEPSPDKMLQVRIIMPGHVPSVVVYVILFLPMNIFPLHVMLCSYLLLAVTDSVSLLMYGGGNNVRRIPPPHH
jgi:hypothetical protein